MSVVSVRARSFILALFIRDDGERFLLGDNGYDFKDNQLHFSANTIENDEVQKQGADGVMLAGQVRRSSVQGFDGYVGDATMPKETIEQMRRDFFAFFVKGHHFRVIYVDCNRNAWQRKGGYLVDAPEVKELWQIHPEYHVGLNFEDVNYYSYNEDSEGEEILANLVDVPVSTAASGGLVWDEDGAVSEDATVSYDTETATSSKGNLVTISDATEAPIDDYSLYGNTVQNGTPTPSAPVPVQTVTGENVVKIDDGQGNEQSYEVNLGKNLINATEATTTINDITFTNNGDGTYTANGTASAATNFYLMGSGVYEELEPGTYTASDGVSSGEGTTTFFTFVDGPSSSPTVLNSPVSFTLTSTTSVRLRIVVRNGAHLDNVVFKPMLEKGSTATDFAPYFTPIELCKIGDYQDYIYKDGSDWKIHKEVSSKILTRDNMDSLSVSQRTSGYQFDFGNSDAHIGNTTGYWFFSNCFAQNYFNNRDNILNSIYGYTDSRVRILTNVATDTSGFKDWVEANSPIIYYVLATPTDTTITNAALIAQLDAILTNAKTYAGTTNISLVATVGNATGELQVTYYTKYNPIVTSGGYVWEAGGAGGATTVINNSIDNVSPVWKIFGPTTNPQLENSTTGETIEYVGTIAEGQTLTIDMGEQTASLDGLNVISNLVGDFISLAPGANKLIYSVSGDAGASEIGWSEIVG